MNLTQENVHIIQTDDISFALVVTETLPQEGVIFKDHGEGKLKKDSGWLPISPYKMSLQLAINLRDELIFEDVD